MTDIQNPYDLPRQRFVLIRNSGIRILPEDIIDITTFPDVLILPDEPEGFNDAKITLERDVWHGLNYEYSLEVLMFGTGFGKDYLSQVFFEDGTDADVKFVYGFGTIQSLDILYVGKLDFNEYALENAEYVKSNLIKDDFGNILQTAFDLPQEVIPDKDVLLYSKVIPKKVEYFVNPKDNQSQSNRRSADMTEFGGVFGNSQDGYLFLNETKEGDSSVRIFPSYPFQLDNISPPTTGANFKYLFRGKEVGEYKLNLRHQLEFSIAFDDYSDWDETVVTNVLRQTYFITEPDGFTLVGTEQSFDPINITITEFSGTKTGRVFLQFDQQISVNIEFDQCFYYYILFDVTSMPSNSVIFSILSVPFNGDRLIPQIEIVAETTANSSKAKLISPYNALNNVFKLSAGIDSYDIVKSDFFESGCGSKLNLTNGYNIRGVSNRPIVDTPKKLFEKFGNLFCLGWGIEYDNLNNEVVKIEPAEYFYQDELLFSIEDISDYDFKVDPSAYYNEIETGFTRYSKQRETEKGNTLDDIHTKHIYQTPIKTNKSKLSITSDLILSGYELEFLRRKQFDKEGRSENASFKEDEEVFGVQLISDTVFTGNNLSGLLTDLTDGDIINLTTSSIIFVGNGYYYIGQEVDVNVDSQGNKRTTIQSVEAGSFRPIGFPFNVGGTKVTFDTPIDSSIFSINPSVIISLVDGESYVIPESNQPFESTSNLVSPQTGYNLRYTPKRILLNWAKLYNGGFRTKQDSEPITFKQGDGNVQFSSRFRSTETCLLGDVDRDTIVEGGNINLIDTFNRNYLFLPYKVTFKCSLNFAQLNYIRRAMRGISSDFNNYGYIQYVSPSGVTEQIFITKITFSPTELEAEIEGWLKDIGQVNQNFIVDELLFPIIDQSSNKLVY
jgi:hypothetical protein